MNAAKKRKHFPLHKLIPNLITIGALCSGLSAVRFAMLDRWEMAVTFIALAAFLDGIDGTVARLLKATSNFGAQLDSLSDFVCFGVAPALMLYMWALEDVKRFGWAAVLLYVVCCGMRLARFNTSLMEQEKEAWQTQFFTGVPAPAGALLAILPLIFSLQFGTDWLTSPWILIAYMPFVGILMVSRIPTLSTKGKRIPRQAVLPFMLGSIVLVVSLFIETWATLTAAGVLYLLSIPVSAFQARRTMAKLAAAAENDDTND